LTREVFIGIDLGGTNCRGALVTAAGDVLMPRRMATRIGEGLDSLLTRLVGLCTEVIEAAGKKGMIPCAVGIGVPGIIEADGIVRLSPNLPPLNEVPLAARLQADLGLPVVAVNDANAIAWGEALFGAGREFSSFLTVTLGTGVGGGIILNRQLWLGSDGTAGEVGHLTVEPSGRLCGCGNRGCLEQYASATGIVRSVREAIAAGEESLLTSESPAGISSRMIGQAARQGDRVALAALEVAGRRLGQVLAGIANLLNPDGAVITGGPSESLDLMLPSLQEEIRLRAFDIPARRFRIVRGERGDEAGIVGAAHLAMSGLEWAG
jgi:glucokinase